MLKIINGANIFVLTLNEKSTLTSPYYLMRFINDLTGTDKATILSSDTSTHPYRYNKFTFTEGVDDALNSSLDLSPSGTWSYEVYEQESDTNLNLNHTGGLVEIGRVRVVGASATETYNKNNDTEVYNVWQG